MFSKRQRHAPGLTVRGLRAPEAVMKALGKEANAAADRRAASAGKKYIGPACGAVIAADETQEETAMTQRIQALKSF